MMSGLPRPAIAGSAKAAPASASLRISGSGLISVFIGIKPETILPAYLTVETRAPRLSRPRLPRAAAGSASRFARASLRSRALGVSCRGRFRHEESAEPHKPSSVIPGTYISRWAPYDRDHGPGQGQLPRDRKAPGNLTPNAPRSPATNVVLLRSDAPAADYGLIANPGSALMRADSPDRHAGAERLR